MLNKKKYFFPAGALLLLVLCYQLAFKKTIVAWQTHSRLKAQLAQAGDLSYQPAYLQRKNSNLDQVLALYQTDTAAFRNNSISRIALVAEKENVKLSEVPLADPYLHSDKLIMQKISLAGDYFALTRTLHTLQTTKDIGIIRSVAYKTTRGTTNLTAEIYLEIAR